MIAPTDYHGLLDYRRSVSRLYAGARGETAGSPLDQAARSQRFRVEREALLKDHSQSPLRERDRPYFSGPEYFDYDPALRFSSLVDRDVEPGTLEISLQDDGPLRLRRFGKVRFEVGDEECALTLFWISGYGGGVFLPFKNGTSGRETYGGGRYLLDTIKHADLGSEDGRLILDFNNAYDPSCTYNSRWHCPLSPPENNLQASIAAGEKSYVSSIARGGT
jgi:uncharacterized protein (DUF1684 family)